MRLIDKNGVEYDVFLLVTQAYSDKVKKKKSECSQQESNL